MHSLLKSSLLVSVVLSSLAFAQPQGEVVIRSRDGKTRMGRVLSETSKGYLLAGPDGTEVVEFASIIDIRQLAPSASAAPAVPVPVPAPAPVAPAPVAKSAKQSKQQPVAVVAAPPPPPAPEPEPVVEFAPPPPPPERPTQPTVNEVISDAGEPKSPREGFHFGLGAGAFILPYGPLAQLQAHFEFNFGRPVYRISANLGALAMYGNGMVQVSVDNLFQFNVGDVYAFGAGVEVGLVLGSMGWLHLAPVIQPVVLKFGDRGQHQLSLTGSLSLLSTESYGYSGSVTFAGTAQVYLGYSFLF